MERESELQHFSHFHALQPFVVQYHGEAVCNACSVPCPVGTAYRCAPCSYFLDRTCAHTPQAIRHPGHPGHTLNLHAAPTYAGDSSSCGACGGRVTSFSFHCTACEFVLHISCANAPLQLHHHSHKHPLALVFSSPYDGTSFACDVCRQIGGENGWLYRCAPCGFDAHIGCATSHAPPQGHYHHHHQQQHQYQQPQEQQPPCVPRSMPQSFQNQPSPQPPLTNPAMESKPGAIDDAVAVQMLAFGMQQAQLLNQMTNSMVQMHQQHLARPFTSTWQGVDGFMSAPKVPRLDVGGITTTLLQNMTNMSLDAGIAIAGAVAPPAVGINPLSGMLGQQVPPGVGGLSGQQASSGDDFLASFLKGNDLSGTANLQVNPLSGNPEEFLDNLLKNADWIPKGYSNSSGMGNSQQNPVDPSGNPEEFLNNLLKNADWIPKGYSGY